ncbi:hypothetical protein E0Z10_g2233 [Xylaria hypoxylon]|uniref:Uncharacterized protein n=1 Tax=Xylaria hypoxylon TaxID=37992 RepID=A0A4Z0YRK4_9PEZI|nr:hypothetical protein E0Z10_g2233 [Xylaria hypoxylon]
MSSAVGHQRQHIVSPRRHLVLRRARQRIFSDTQAFAQSEDEESTSTTDDKREILSSYRVLLPANKYTASVHQTIQTPDGEKLSFDSSKQFHVIAPRFSLPASVVHSTYPSQGHQDTVDILPHIVFNDAHLPWERTVTDQTDTIDKTRNRVPWLALLTFTHNELQIPDNALKRAKNTTATATQALRLDSSTVTAFPGVSTPLSHLENVSGDVSVIFVTAKLFNAYVTTFDPDGKPTSSQNRPDVSRYKYLSHVRRLSTMGMAESGGQELALKSVVMAHRLAPLDALQPMPIIVHLVSLEGIESMSFPVPGQKTVALVSLHSWIYTALPPSSLNTHDLFITIGHSIDLLCTPASTIARISSPPLLAGDWLQRRLRDGYTLTRYRTKTGEVTAAMTRGPFTPSLVPHPLTKDWNSISYSGESLQIIDSEVGFIDLSYSAAWNLGKSMALADPVFSAALCRIRSEIYAKAMDKTKKHHLQGHRALPSRLSVVSSLSRLSQELSHLAENHHLSHQHPQPFQAIASDPSPRWHHTHPKRLDLSFRAPHIKSQFREHALTVARRLASSLDNPNEPYDEHNTPYSADWALVFRWMLDRMYLVDVPAHYLVTESSHLPPETLRFFHVDLNWIDAFSDGALSICNHIGSDDVRSAIKAEFQRYLDTTNPAVGYKPQIPTYGFLLRSKLVTLFPDLHVSTSPAPTDGRAPILRQENLGQDLLLCLLDRVPSNEFNKLVFTQPPHQLSFAAAASVGMGSFTTEYKRVYTKHVEDQNRAEKLTTRTWTRGSASPPPVFVWNIDDNDAKTDGQDATKAAAPLRMLIVPAWASDVFKTIERRMKDPDQHGSNHSDWFQDSVPSAALNAIQLANPAYTLEIKIHDNLPESDSSVPAQSLKLLQGVEGRDGEGEHQRPPTAHAPSHLSFQPASLGRTRMTPQVQQQILPHIAKHMRPPHFPRLFKYEPNPVVRAAAEPSSTGGIQTVPKIDFSLSAAGRPLERPIPSKTDTPLDLIFSILVAADDSSSYKLKEVDVTIFLGPADQSSSSPTLMDDYDGPGATMLSNMRLHALVQHDTDREKRALHIRLLPRSRSRQISVTKLSEMSFCLAMADVNAYDAEVTVQIRAKTTYDSNLVETWFEVKLNAETSL